MTLSVGRRLGPYEILSPIGAGGMGEVFRAKDTRLDRSVAIKVLSSHLSSNPQLRERFDREARAVSALNHPNICTLYDVGHQDGIDYIVMELLEGETLAARLTKGPLPLEQVLRYGAQIADGLNSAHKQGIIHRDLKPGNIMLVRSGAKLLDFGLAKTGAGNISSPDAATEQKNPLTAEGTILGTFQYMAPEQLVGEEADARTDIFALGVTLFEMATGRRAFEGKSRTSLIAAIVSSEPPPMSQFQPQTSPALEHLIKKCLAKERDDRWQSVHDIAEQLRWIGETGSQTDVAAPPGTRRRHRERMWILNLVTAVAAVALTWLFMELRRTPPSLSLEREVTRFTIPWPNYSSDPSFPLINISRDGKTIAYVREDGEARKLYLRSLNALADRVVSESAGATSPFFSPDGKSIAFAANGKLTKLRLEGEQSISLIDSGDLRGGSWGSDGTIVYASAKTGTLFQMPENGGEARELTKLDIAGRELRHQDPQLLPGNQTVLFVRVAGFGTDSTSRIEALDLATGKRRPIPGGEKVGSFRYIPGYLLFTQDDRLFAIGFDAGLVAVTGKPIPVLDPIWTAARFVVSDTGTLLYQSSEASQSNVRIMRATGKNAPTPLALPPGVYSTLVLSPDDRHLAVTFRERGGIQIATVDLERGSLSPLTSEGTSHIAVWTADGERLIYSCTRGGPSNLFWQRAHGGEEAEPLIQSPNHQDPGSVSSDGQGLAYAERNAETGWDLWFLPLAGERLPTPYRRTSANEYSPMISPDNRWVAFVSDETKRAEVYVDSFPKPSRRSRVSIDGGVEPLWSRDGKRLFFRNGAQIFGVEISTNPFEAGLPQLVIHGAARPNTGFGAPSYAITKNGSLLFPGRTVEPMLIVVMHWTAELDKRMKSGQAR